MIAVVGLFVGTAAALLGAQHFLGLDKHSMVRSSQVKMELPGESPTLCLILDNPSGLGNKLYGMVGYIALARATNRTVAVSGPAAIWKPFWTSDFQYMTCNPDDVDFHCDAASLKDHESPCSKALFDSPEKVVQIEVKLGYGDEMSAATSHPLFKQLYMENVLGEYPSIPKSWFDRREIYFSMELPKILKSPTKKFASVIQKFEHLHNLSSIDDGDYAFDLAFHVRVCVDCGWEMNRESIAANIRCAIEEFINTKRLKPEDAAAAKIFVTSDTRKYLDDIVEQIPPGATVVENIPKQFIHTTTKRYRPRKFEQQAMPYLDSYLLGRSRLVGSCWTTFGYMSLRVGKS